MKYVKLYVHRLIRVRATIYLARTRIKLWIFISFLPNKLGNNDRIAGQDLPNIDGQNYIHQIVGWNIQFKWASLCFLYLVTQFG